LKQVSLQQALLNGHDGPEILLPQRRVPILLDQLPDDNDALKRIIAEMAKDDAAKAPAEIAKLRFQLDRNRRGESGRSPEELEREVRDRDAERRPRPNGSAARQD
jgi:hypothetical protein